MYSLGYFSLIILIILIESVRKKKSRVDSFSIFNFLFIYSYLMPATLWATFPEMFQRNLPYNLNYNAALTPEVFFTLYVAYLTFAFFYSIFKMVKFPVTLSLIEINYTPNEKRRRLLYLIGFFSLLVVFMIFLTGGLNEYISSSLEARHNKVDFGFSGYLNYLLSAALFCFISSTFLVQYKNDFNLNRIHIIILLIFLALIFISLVARGGRASIVNIFLYVIIFLFYTKKININIKLIITMLILVPVILFVIYYFRKISGNIIAGVYILNDIDINVFIESIGVVLLYPFQYFAHLLYVIVEFFKNPYVYEYPRMGSDILSGIILVLPGFNGQSIGLPELPDIISQNILGKTNGYIPPGWIGWSLMDGGYIFLIIKLLFSALVCAFFDFSYKFLNQSGNIGKLLYFLFIFIVTNMLFIGTAMNLFRGNLGQFIFIFSLALIPGLRLVKMKLLRT